jgi:hypothetical protein
MLFALVFDDGEITARVRAIQAFPHLGQNEAAGLLRKRTDSVDGNHQQQGWRGGAKGSRSQGHGVSLLKQSTGSGIRARLNGRSADWTYEAPARKPSLIRLSCDGLPLNMGAADKALSKSLGSPYASSVVINP